MAVVTMRQLLESGVLHVADAVDYIIQGCDALAEARAVQSRVRQAMEAKRGDQTKLQGVWDRLTTRSGPYEDAMFIDQLSNVNREIGEADQGLGASAFDRFNQLVKEWSALKADAEAALR